MWPFNKSKSKIVESPKQYSCELQTKKIQFREVKKTILVPKIARNISIYFKDGKVKRHALNFCRFDTHTGPYSLERVSLVSGETIPDVYFSGSQPEFKEPNVVLFKYRTKVPSLFLSLPKIIDGFLVVFSGDEEFRYNTQDIRIFKTGPEYTTEDFLEHKYTDIEPITSELL